MGVGLSAKIGVCAHKAPAGWQGLGGLVTGEEIVDREKSADLVLS